MEKCQIWVETQPSAQSSFQKLNVDNNYQKTRKIKYYIFQSYCISLFFAKYFVQDYTLVFD